MLTIINTYSFPAITFSSSTSKSTPGLGDMASEADLKAFIGRHRELLSKERNAEIERTALLLTNCGPKLLEQKGLALGSLSVVGINIGLGGKTCGVIHSLLYFRFLIAVLRKSAD